MKATKKLLIQALKKIVEEIFLKKERQTDSADRQRQLAIEKEVLTKKSHQKNCRRNFFEEGEANRLG